MKEEIEKLLDCSKCNLKECISCEITYADRKNIREYIEEIEHEKDIMQRVFKMQTVGWNEGAKLFAEKQKLVEKLEEDIKSNNKSMTDVLNYTNMIKATRVLYAQEILNFISK